MHPPPAHLPRSVWVGWGLSAAAHVAAVVFLVFAPTDRLRQGSQSTGHRGGPLRIESLFLPSDVFVSDGPGDPGSADPKQTDSRRFIPASGSGESQSGELVVSAEFVPEGVDDMAGVDDSAQPESELLPHSPGEVAEDLANWSPATLEPVPGQGQAVEPQRPNSPAGSSRDLPGAVPDAPLPRPKSARPVMRLLNQPPGGRKAGASGLAANGGVSGTAGPRTGSPPARSGRAGSTTFFQARGRGARVVYLIDCSDSMWEMFDAVREELLGSLERRQGRQSACVLFYNDEVLRFEPRAGHGGPADREPVWIGDHAGDRRLAARFIRSIVPTGGTDHLSALMAALALDPDVVFLLTDASDPVLSPAQLRRIRRANTGGTVIHAINCGHEIASANFLQALAEQNSGEYVEGRWQIEEWIGRRR